MFSIALFLIFPTSKHQPGASAPKHQHEDTMKKSQIYIDDSGTVHVSYQCDSCSDWVHTDDHCGDDGQYLCPDCYGQQRADQKHIHNWLIFLDEDNPLDCSIAIHKDVVHPDRIDAADCSMPQPPDDMSWFGPGTLASSVYAFEDLHMDVGHVWALVDEGFITWQGATQIFLRQGGA